MRLNYFIELSEKKVSNCPLKFAELASKRPIIRYTSINYRNIDILITGLWKLIKIIRPFPEKDFSSRKGVFCAKRKLVETAEFV